MCFGGAEEGLGRISALNWWLCFLGVFRIGIVLLWRDIQRGPTIFLKGLYWEPQIGNPKNIAGI